MVLLVVTVSGIGILLDPLCSFKAGVGKSTLLRHIAMREVPIPAHITILFVEQEVRTQHNIHPNRFPLCLTSIHRLSEMIQLPSIRFSKQTFGETTCSRNKHL